MSDRILAGGLLAAGLVIAACLLAPALGKIGQSDRYVEVKGLAEREVPANLAIWPLVYSATGNDLPQVQSLLERDADRILAFLADQGFDAEDITRSVRAGEDLAPASAGKDLELSTRLSSGGSVGSGGMAMDMGSISQSAAPLSSQQQIAMMVQDVLRRQLPRLRPCYESSLRANPGFQGSWVLTFTVETDGSVAHAKASPTGPGDELFEQCLVRRIEGWRFKRIVKPQPVKKTVDFKK